MVGTNANRIRALYGILVVYRHELRGRRLWRLLVGNCGIAAGVAVLSIPVRAVLFGPVTDYANGASGVLAQWLTAAAMAAVLFMMPLAAILAEGAVPAREAISQTQTALLTSLSAWDLCTGRLLAALSTLHAAIIASFLFWVCMQRVFRGLVPGEDAVLSIAAAHLVLLCATAMVAAVGMLFGLGRRPGRAVGRGITAGVGLSALCIGAVFAVSPFITQMTDPSRLIEGTLVVNPVYAAESALHRDILRTPWIYDHLQIADYAFAYPPPLVSAGIFAMVALAALVLSAIRLRRAYR